MEQDDFETLMALVVGLAGLLKIWHPVGSKEWLYTDADVFAFMNQAVAILF